MKKATVVVTGQVRDELDVARTFQGLLALRRDGLVDAIVLSTWFGEADQIVDLRKTLLKAGVKIVESISPPSQLAVGVAINSWMQMKMLQEGLMVADPEAPVFKVRTDKCAHFFPRYRPALAEGLRPTTDQYGVSPRLRWRTQVVIAKTGYLLHYRDSQFFGSHADLSASISFDGAYDCNCVGRSMDPETRFFVKPFYDSSPFLRDAFGQIHMWNLQRAVLAFVRDSPTQPFPRVVNDVLAHHFLITASNFGLFSERSETKDAEFFDLFRTQATPLALPAQNSVDVMPYFAGEWALDAAITGKLRNSRAYRAFMDSIDSVRGSGQDEFRYNSAEWTDFCSFLDRVGLLDSTLERNYRARSEASVPSGEDQSDIDRVLSVDAAMDRMFDMFSTPAEHRAPLKEAIARPLYEGTPSFELARLIGLCYAEGNRYFSADPRLGIPWLEHAIKSRSLPAKQALTALLERLELAQGSSTESRHVG